MFTDSIYSQSASISPLQYISITQNEIQYINHSVSNYNNCYYIAINVVDTLSLIFIVNLQIAIRVVDSDQGSPKLLLIAM